MYSHNLGLERTQRMASDGLAVFLAALVAVWIRHGLGLIASPEGVPWSAYLFPAAAVAVLMVVVLRLAGSYHEPHRVVPAPLVFGALGIATVTALTIGFFYRSESYSRATVLIFFPLAALAVMGMRYGYDRYVRVVRGTSEAARRVLIVGRCRAGRRLAASLERRPAYYELVGFVADDAGPSNGNGNGSHDGEGPPVLGRIADLGQVIEDEDIDEVLIGAAIAPDRVVDLIGECMKRKVAWKAVPNTYGLRLDRIRVDEFDGIPLVGTRDTPLVGSYWMLKRVFDVVFASAVLVMLSPLLLAIAVGIRLTSRGPILYKQTRIGLNGEPFTILKFRSMATGSGTTIHSDFTREWIYGRSGSEENGNGNGNGAGSAVNGNGSLHVNGNGSAHGNGNANGKAAAAANGHGNGNGNGGVHKLTRDPRVTKVGRVIRATSLDELPQFWNVLRGDMSVVGPRPALPYEVDRYTEWHKRRLSVPPGITGEWQVSGRNELSFKEMVDLDISYMETWSLGHDVKTVLKTVPALLKQRGK